MLRAGDFYVGPYPPGSGKRRRIVLLTPEHRGKVVAVFLSTLMTDQTVILHPGCHPQITKECCVVYEQTELSFSKTIDRALAHGALELHEPLNSELLREMQEGLFASDDVSLEIVDFAKDLI